MHSQVSKKQLNKRFKKIKEIRGHQDKIGVGHDGCDKITFHAELNKSGSASATWSCFPTPQTRRVTTFFFWEIKCKCQSYIEL